MLENTTSEDLVADLDAFDTRVKNTGRVALLAAALTLIGAVLVLLG